MAGYIGSQTPVVSNGSQRKYTFTATAAQTVFTGMDIPNPQQIQVFQNGVRLVITTDYTVSSGTTVTLVNAASAGDSLVVILFADYQLLDQDLSGDFSVDSPTFVVDSANNRVGIGTTSTVAQSKMTIAGNSLSITGFDNGFTSGGNRAMIDFGANYMRLGGLTGGGSTVNGIKFITPAGGDAAILDSDGLKFNGDTAAANALNDYEEGTFTPQFIGTGSNPTVSYNASNKGVYIKIGRMVNFVIALDVSSYSGGAGAARVTLPFTVQGSGDYSQNYVPFPTAQWGTQVNPTRTNLLGRGTAGAAEMIFRSDDNTGSTDEQLSIFPTSGFFMRITGSYTATT